MNRINLHPVASFQFSGLGSFRDFQFLSFWVFQFLAPGQFSATAAEF
jgi:hypothetical protein